MHVSFDIINLYTNILVNETLKIIKEKLNNSKLFSEATDELMTLLNAVINQH